MSVNIAVQGCCHGELDVIYDCIREAENKTGKHIELLIIGGDFECLRCTDDLNSIAVPQKYKHMNSFHEYLIGTKIAPVLTIFIGGNHEASNVLQDLYYGGQLNSSSTSSFSIKLLLTSAPLLYRLCCSQYILHGLRWRCSVQRAQDWRHIWNLR